MKNILLVLVGGTICTSLNQHGTLSVNEKAGVKLKSNFENSNSPYAKKVNIDITENLFILSENITVEKWNLIIDTYRKYTENKKYDGIIFAHGTDTLAYSSALFSMLLSGTDVPVFFVSANERLDSPKSNGNDNFKCAMECICQNIHPNIYVPYKNISDGKMYLHMASRLEQCKNYSEDFYSTGMIDITDITDENCNQHFDKIKKLFPKGKKAVNIYDSWNLKECVLMITPYVGVNYSIFNYKPFKAVLHGTYHSGTACAQQSIYNNKYDDHSLLYMIDQCSTLGVDTYISPSKLTGEVYETTGIIGNHIANDKKINFLYGLTNETAYAKLVIAYSMFETEEQRKDFLNTEYNYEFIK